MEDKNIIQVMYGIILFFAIIILILLFVLVNAKEQCDNYYDKKVQEFIADNNVCLGNIQDRIERGLIQTNITFNKSEWRIEE